MAVREPVFNRYLATLCAVCRSPDVGRYRIGYTKRAMEMRGRQYNSTGWPHIVMLADKLTRDDALVLEERLFNAMRADKRSVLYSKYDLTVRAKSYRRSDGGTSPDDGEEFIHGVYMAWRGP